MLGGLERRFNTCINIQDLEQEYVTGTGDIEDDVYRVDVNKQQPQQEPQPQPQPQQNEEEKPEKVRRHLPPPTGPYSVGCVDIMDGNHEQGSFFRLFYPTEKTDIFQRNTQWPLWLPRKQYALGYAHFLGRKRLLGKFFKWLGGDLYIPALWQAPLVDSNTAFPVVILSHGIGGNRTTYSTYCLELASHGVIVLAPEHRDGSASMTYLLKDNLSRNTVELIKDHELGKHRRQFIHKSHSFTEEWKFFEHTDPLGIKWDDFKYRNQQVHIRATECCRVIDVLSNINKGYSVRNYLGFCFNLKQFKNRIDMDRIAFAGHSFGGSTLVAALAMDERFKCGVMLDGWMHPVDEELCSRVTQPVLMVNYEKFQWQQNVRKMEWLQKETDEGPERTMLTILGACHQAISDFQFACNKTFGRLMEVRSDLAPKTAMYLNKTATLAFMAKHLDLPFDGINDAILRAEHDLVVLGSVPNLPENRVP